MDSIFWLAATAAFGAVEAATTALVSVWFAVGSAAALIVSLFTDSLGAQFVVFAVVSAIALGIMVPALARRRKEHAPPVTNGSPLTIGKRGTVLRTIQPGELGRVHVDGLDWQARSDTTLSAGEKCEVKDVDGAVLIVIPVPAEMSADSGQS
ncbi:MAG: NfeD family protein [Gemmiger sp.]